MANITLDIGKPTISELFSEQCSFYVPDFQRNYVWGSNSDKSKDNRHVNLLLEDILFAKENNFDHYYLGSIITYRNKKEKEWEYQLIDGQQRITTLILFTLAYRNYLSKIGGQNPQISSVDNYLYKFISTTEKVEEVNILRSSNLNASKYLSDLFQGKDLSKNVYKNTKEIQDAYKTCEKFINTELKDLIGSKSFFEYIKDNVFLTWVKTENFDEAFTIFERTNDRGVQLTLADKVKHYVLSTLLHSKEEFAGLAPEINKIWADVEDKLNEKNIKFDSFLRYHFVARYWEDKYRQSKEVLAWLKSDEGKKKTSVVNNPLKFVEKMYDDAKLYNKFRDSLDLNDEITPHLSFPKSYFSSVTQHFPMLIAASLHNDKEFFNSVLKKVEGLIFVFSWSKAQWNNVERELHNLCTHLRNKDIRKFNILIKELIDDQIDAARQNLVNPEFCSENYMKTKYVVHRVDYEICTQAKLTTNLRRDTQTLEHIIPQNSEKGLKLSCPPKTDIDEYKQLIHRIGNMTLLSRTHNPIAGDATPERKILLRKEINSEGIEESIQPLYSGTAVPITKVLLDGNFEVSTGSDKTNHAKVRDKFGFGKPNMKNGYWTESNVSNREKAFFKVLSDIFEIKI